MSKHRKTLERICSSPTPADIRWQELKAAMESLGYEMTTGKGSRRRFFHKGKKALITCHEPHPSPHVDKACIVDFVEHLINYGLIRGRNGNA